MKNISIFDIPALLDNAIEQIELQNGENVVNLEQIEMLLAIKYEYMNITNKKQKLLSENGNQ